MAKQDRLRVLLVDDHPLFRSGLRMLLEASDPTLAVEEVASVEDAAERRGAASPDVILLEVATCGDDVVGSIDLLAAEGGTPILMFSKHEQGDALVPALQAGAVGYVPDTRDVVLFVDCLRRAAAGEYIVDPVLAKRLVLRLRELRGGVAGPAGRAPWQDLSERERQILRLVAGGSTNRNVATELGISESTVKNHLNSIFTKLRVSSRSQAIVEALKHDLLPR